MESKKAGAVYTISTDKTDNPKLKGRAGKSGKTSLFLEYNQGYSKEFDETEGREKLKVERLKERLKLSIWTNPKTAAEREENKNVLELAKRIRFERGQEFLESSEGYRLREAARKVDFLEYFRNYYNAYQLKDRHVIKIAFVRFYDYLAETPKYAFYTRGIKPAAVTPAMVEGFAAYLKPRSRGTGAATIYRRFKKVVRKAVKDGIMKRNPCDGITIPCDDMTITKDVLSVEEVRKMHSTHYPRESEEVRRAFLFCCYAGVRFCDVTELRYKNVDYSNRLLRFTQKKTEGRSAHSGVVTPLNGTLLTLIGMPPKGDLNALIFVLPSFAACLNHLKRWTAAAGIPKRITWHSARHSFALNILNNGANIKTVSALLGHSSILMTEKYTRAVDSLKAAAIDSLPPLDSDTGGE